MGLDAVELVIAVEEEFGLQIPDSAAEKMQRVEDLFRFVVNTLRQRGDTLDDAIIWTRLTDVIVEQLGVKPEAVVPNAHFIEDFRIE
jgi:acyl carrier protein